MVFLFAYYNLMEKINNVIKDIVWNVWKCRPKIMFVIELPEI